LVDSKGNKYYFTVSFSDAAAAERYLVNSERQSHFAGAASAYSGMQRKNELFRNGLGSGFPKTVPSQTGGRETE
jgi:hypothetical protein